MKTLKEIILTPFWIIYFPIGILALLILKIIKIWTSVKSVENNNGQ